VVGINAAFEALPCKLAPTTRERVLTFDAILGTCEKLDQGGGGVSALAAVAEIHGVACLKELAV
jgi:hypothetical protein